MADSYLFEIERTRFYRQIWQMTMLLAVHAKAAFPYRPNPNIHLSGNTIPFNLIMNFEGAYEMFRSNRIGSSIHWGKTERHLASRKSNYFDTNHSGFMHDIFSGLFVLAFDPYIYWLKCNYGTNYHSWPPYCAFARLVRNAISHSGTVNLNSENAPSGEWMGTRIGHAQNGMIIGEKITIGDYLVLMYDLNEELEVLGAPLHATWQTLKFVEGDPSIVEESRPPPDQAAIS
ncbi:hypothetical protein [Sphingomonas azotifigens]|uniref:hypothetical protein n=1 Tax=Sphingomonas azotifigens TaxID=330920 RepID=UPI00111C7F13|nr:hypothetical protein [Sphingomonas azotifigens]